VDLTLSFDGTAKPSQEKCRGILPIREKRDYSPRYGSSVPAQEEIDRTGAAMAWLCRCDREDLLPQLRKFEPSLNRAPQDSGPIRTKATSGNYEHATPSHSARSRDKNGERSVGFGLRHPVQIKACFDLVQTALQPLGICAIDACKAIERWWRGSRITTGSPSSRFRKLWCRTLARHITRLPVA
jgi:hypothetical protein